MTQLFDWLQAAKGQPEPSLAGGASGYLSPPSSTLDPHLFDGERLKPDVRNRLSDALVLFLVHDLHLNKPHSWLRIWLAGSGITYQWASDRGNGDLDVLLGVNKVKFDKANPGFADYSDDDLAAALNDALKTRLWPQTAKMDLGGQDYEVTYFYNAGTGTDITRIHPYAAYDLVAERWVVRPPKLPHDPASLYPMHWFEAADQDVKAAQALVDRYHEQERALRASPPGSPGHITAGAMMNLVAAQAHAMFNDIHQGRRIAFQGGGRGYMDIHNFRWQMAKASGTIKALSEITGIQERARELTETELYGGPLAAADELVRRAMHRGIQI